MWVCVSWYNCCCSCCCYYYRCYYYCCCCCNCYYYVMILKCLLIRGSLSQMYQSLQHGDDDDENCDNVATSWCVHAYTLACVLLRERRIIMRKILLVHRCDVPMISFLFATTTIIAGLEEHHHPHHHHHHHHRHDHHGDKVSTPLPHYYLHQHYSMQPAYNHCFLPLLFHALVAQCNVLGKRISLTENA